MLVLTQATTGAFAGLIAALLYFATPLPRIGGVEVAVMAMIAGVADLARIRPLAVRRQVPHVWSRMFAPGTVALLYGARLGVAPLTILPTWLWWAAFVGGAASGPAASALVGAAFGLARGLTSLAATANGGGATVQRMALIVQGERAAHTLAAVAALAVGAAALTSG